MACFITSEASVKSQLKKLGLIDEYLNILNLGAFRTYVTTISKYAKEKYGIEERLFFEEQNGTKAVPNTGVFQTIDRKKGIRYPENEWVDDIRFPESEIDEMEDREDREDKEEQDYPDKDSLYFQQTQISRNRLTPEVKDQLLTFLTNVNPNFKVEVIDNLSVNGLVQISDSLIQLKKGQEDFALSEEVAHVYVELLSDKVLKSKLMDDVVRTKMYRWVLEEYKEVYSRPEQFKNEAAAKLISLYIQDREAFNYWSGSNELNTKLGNLIRRLLDWIRKNFINPYSKAAIEILKGSTQSISLSLAKEGTYYQLDHRYKEFDSIQEKNITKYQQIYINLNNTLLDYANWKANPVGDKDAKKVKSTFWEDAFLLPELERYYRDSNLTKLGRELRDKMTVLNPERITIYTDAPITDTLITRLETEFGKINIVRTGYNIYETFFDEFGNPIDMMTSGSEKKDFLEHQVRDNPTSDILVIDNQALTLEGDNLTLKKYDNAYARYTDVETQIRQETLERRNKQFNQDVINELSKVDKNNLVQLARQSMNMVKNQVRKLEGKGLEELSNIFRDSQGNLLVPILNKQQLLTTLLDNIDTFEQGLLNFVQTIESTRMFFHNANENNFEALRELIGLGDTDSIDKALRETAFLMRMILSWEEWVKEIRPYINDSKVVKRVIDEFDSELKRSNIKLNEIALDVLSKSLSEQWKPFNEAKKKLLDDGYITHEQYEDTIYSTEKILKWLLGEYGDIQTGSAYLENPLRHKEPLIQAISKKIELSLIGAEYESMKKVNEFQGKAWELSDRIGNFNETNNQLTYIDQENYWEDGVMKQRPSLFILNQWKDLWMKRAEEEKVNILRKELKELKESNQPFESKEIEYLNAKQNLDLWKQENWYDEVTNTGKNIYREFGIHDTIFERAIEKQKEIYDQIKRYTLDLQRVYLTEQMEQNLNEEIERLVKELRLLRNEYTPQGQLKQGENLLIAKKLKDKSLIDRQIYDYEFQTQDFLNAINEQILSISDESVRTILLRLIDTNDLSELDRTAKEIAPQSFIDWLDRNTRIRFSDSFYEERKKIIEGIKEIQPNSNIDQLWKDITNLTSYLRDKDMVLDGSDSTPEIQQIIKNYELELENIKQNSEKNKALNSLIQRLTEIQSKKYTDFYKDVLYDFLKDIYPISSNENFISLINTKEFKTFLESAPQEFKEWFDRNHLTKLVWDEATESKIPKTFPIYIWMKNEPTDSTQILLIPGWKYSKRILKESATVEFNNQTIDIQLKTPKIDWITWNPLEENWLPKSERFKNPEYKRLKESENPQDKLLFEYLTLILDKHIEIQKEGNYDSRIGFAAPRFHKKYTESNLGQIVKRAYKSMTETLQAKEEGTGGEVKNSKSWRKKVLAFAGIESEEQIQTVTRTDYIGNQFKTIYTPYTQYLKPEDVSTDLVLSITNYSNGVEKVKALIKDLPQINLLQQVFEEFKPKKKGTVNQYGDMIDAGTNNRLNVFNNVIETKLYANFKDFELGQGVDRFANMIKRTAVVGSQSDLNLPNAIKNWLQGQLMNFIFIKDGGWGTRKSLNKARRDYRTSYANFIYELGKKNKSIDFHIIQFFNPLLEKRTADFSKNARSTELQDRVNIVPMFSSTAAEFSVASTLLYAHLYNQDVTIDNSPAKLYDSFTIENGVLTIKPNTFINERLLTTDYIQELKLRFKMMLEDIQGKQWNNTLAQRYTVWQSLEFFKRFFVPMFRKRFFTKRDNIELGETEGIYLTTSRYLIRLFYDWLNNTKFSQVLTPQEKINIIAARDEMLLAISTLFIISFLFGFDEDDPDKYKKLEDRSWLSNMALLIAINTKRETDALVPIPWISIQNSVYPPVLNETYNFITSPFVGFTVIQEGRKMLDSLLLLATGDDKALYEKSMPAYLIEKGDSKFTHYLEKVGQIDNFLYQFSPEAKIQVIVQSQNR